MSRSYRIAVVGFGVAGGTASAILARAGQRVELFERAPKVGPVGAGILLMPSGQLVLQRLGWLERATAKGEVIQELHAVKHTGRDLLRISFREVAPEAHAYGLHRGDLFEVIHEEVQRAGVTVHLDHDIRSFRVDGERVWLTDTRDGEHGPFDFLIAADGSRSILRQLSHLVRMQAPYAWGALWVIGRNTAVRGKLYQVVRGTRRLAGLLPMGGDRCSLFWGLHKDEYPPLCKRGLAAWRDEVLGLCPQAEELFADLQDMNQVPFTTYQHIWMRSWHTPHVVFIGDAAHAMSPHLGQGINLALLDAWHLAGALASRSTPLAAFQAYSHARRAHLRFYSVVTYLMAPFFQSSSRLLGWGRDFFLPLMPKLGWLRRQMALTMSGLKSSLFGGPLAI
jgi:2-polyprenyl-6-methoxyphenol hydroxylase-like FAD-dependent oxidoreductase